MYAIIEDSGTQIQVSQGDVIKVDIRDLPPDAATIQFDRVLLVGCGDEDKGETRIGRPVLEGAAVTADILEEGRDEKIDVIKFKRRKNYRRKKGHRQSYLKVKVTSIKG